MTFKAHFLFFCIVGISFSCQRAVQVTPAPSISVLQEIHKSSFGDYAINLPESWVIGFQDFENSPDIVFTTEIVDMLNMKMIHIYRFKTSDSSIADRLNEEVQKGHEFYSQLKLGAVDTLRIKNKSTYRRRTTYKIGNQAYKADNYFVRGENGYDYLLVASSTDNSISEENLREMGIVISSFQTFLARFESFAESIPILPADLSLSSDESFWLVKLSDHFIPEGAKLIGKLPSIDGHHFILYSYAERPILEVYTADGTKINQRELFLFGTCPGTVPEDHTAKLSDDGTKIYLETRCVDDRPNGSRDTIVLKDLILPQK